MITASASLRIVPVAACAVLVVAAGLRWDDYLLRGFWQDEVSTFGMAGAGLDPDFVGLTTDVHPPLYTLLISFVRLIPGVDETPELARLANSLFLPVLAFPLWLIARRTGAVIAGLVLALLLSCWFFWIYAFELRAYFAVFTLSFALLAMQTMAPGRHTGWEIAIGVLLAQFHYFGLALAFASFLVMAHTAWRDGDRARLRRYGFGLVLLLALFAIWSIASARFLGNVITQGFWIQVTPKTYIRFFEWSLPATAVFLIALVLALWTGRLRDDDRRALWQLALIAAIVLAGTLALSQVREIVTTRNLIVLLPVILLASAILLASLPQRQWIAAGLSVATIPVGLSVIASGPMQVNDLRWIAGHVLSERCADLPYVGIPHDFVSMRYVADVYPGSNRPRMSVEAFLDSASRTRFSPEGCSVLGFTYRAVTDDHRVRFAARGFDVRIVEHPDPKIALRTSALIVLESPAGEDRRDFGLIPP